MIRLANLPMPHVTNAAQSVLDLFRSKRLPTPAPAHMHRPIPAPEPDPEPNPAPDAVQPMPRSQISPSDWDELFHAVQKRLETCVDEAFTKAPELPLHDRHEVTKKAVLECVDAMKQLHAALTLERQSQPKQ